jgi:hypothetical protein
LDQKKVGRPFSILPNIRKTLYPSARIDIFSVILQLCQDLKYRALNGRQDANNELKKAAAS